MIGGLAQLVERTVRIGEARGSKPRTSNSFFVFFMRFLMNGENSKHITTKLTHTHTSMTHMKEMHRPQTNKTEIVENKQKREMRKKKEEKT